ncbi:MAG: cytidine(C)-cytidine(C)-adenosine (A)]-adding enzyme [Candidatus Sericytochromatia bacterium]|nr:MAG: cytidine(C)-cytidine(C)-adenosine (A)]-adding enzyme [Candidatus Sericytochromatia bacterium]
MIINFIKEKLELLLTLLKSKIYIVGGFVRENLLGKFSKDIDFIMLDNDLEILNNFSKLSRGVLINLDIEREIFRVTWKSNGVCFDFSFLKTSLKEDLLSRDLTINSIAIELNIELINKIDRKFSEELLIDYSNGISHIKEKTIKLNSYDVIINDPLRLLRVFRFSSKLKFNIDKETLEYISDLSYLIKKVSKERVIKEITEIFSFQKTYKYINLMFETKLYQNIFESFSENINKVIKTLRNIEIIIKKFKLEVENIYLIKLSILFIFKKISQKELEIFLRNLKISYKELLFIINQKKYFDLIDINKIDINNKVFLFYFFKERKKILKESLIIYLSIFYNTKKYDTFQKLFDIYNKEKILYEQDKIIDGNIIKSNFPYIPNNKIGLVLEKINLFQALKEVNNLNDAMNKIKVILAHPEGLEPPTN